MNIFLTMILAMLNILGWAYNPFLIKSLLHLFSFKTPIFRQNYLSSIF